MAIFILVVGIVAVLNMFPLGIQIARSSQMASTAVQLAQARMEQEISKKYTEILCEGSVLPPCQDGKTRISNDPDSPFYSYWEEIRLDYVDPEAGMEASNDDTGIKKIEIIISWRSSLQTIDQNITLINLIAKK